MGRLLELTGMRGVSALLVVGFHAVVLYTFAGPGWPEGPLTRVLAGGWIGVEFFFVLSGFLLALPLLRRRSSTSPDGSWRRYLGRRWLRIAPPFYLSLPLSVLLGGTAAYALSNPGDVLLHLTYLHNATQQGVFSPLGPVYWTLAIEFQFYLILPLFVRLFTGRRWAWSLAACLALSVAWRAATYDANDFGRSFWLAAQLPGFLGHFALGIAAARLRVDGVTLAPALRPWGAAAASALIVAPTFLAQGAGSIAAWPFELWAHATARQAIAAGFALLLLWLLDSVGSPRRFLASRPGVALGEMSYSLYLVHVPIGFFIITHVPAASAHGFAAYTALYLVASLLGAAAFWWAVERPFLTLKDRWTESPRTATPPSIPGEGRATTAGPVLL